MDRWVEADCEGDGGRVARAWRHAVALQQRAVKADPLSTLRRYNLAAILYQAGRLDEAKAELLELRELSPAPDKFSDILGLVLIPEGGYDEALEPVGEWLDEPRRQQGLALAYHGLGCRAEADAALQRLIDLSHGEDRLLVAEVYAYRGEIDAALERLQAASGHPETAPRMHRGRRWLAMMQYSPFLRPLRADPRRDIWLQSIPQPQPERPRSTGQ